MLNYKRDFKETELLLDENELLKCKRFVADKNILLLSINEN